MSLLACEGLELQLAALYELHATKGTGDSMCLGETTAGKDTMRTQMEGGETWGAAISLDPSGCSVWADCLLLDWHCALATESHQIDFLAV